MSSGGEDRPAESRRDRHRDRDRDRRRDRDGGGEDRRRHRSSRRHRDKDGDAQGDSGDRRRQRDDDGGEDRDKDRDKDRRRSRRHRDKAKDQGRDRRERGDDDDEGVDGVEDDARGRGSADDDDKERRRSRRHGRDRASDGGGEEARSRSRRHRRRSSGDGDDADDAEGSDADHTPSRRGRRGADDAEAEEARRATARRRRRLSQLDSHHGDDLVPDDDDIEADPLPTTRIVEFADGVEPDPLRKVVQHRAIRESDDLNSKTGTVYVESLTTGLFRKATGHSKTAPRQSSSPKRRRRHAQNLSEPLSIPVAWGVSTAFLFCQGLLAGMAVLALVLIEQPANELEFLFQFASSSRLLRQAFYVLTTLSMVASGERLLRELGDADRWARKSSGQLMRVWFIPFLYLIALVAGFASMGSDNRITTIPAAVAGDINATLFAVNAALDDRMIGDVSTFQGRTWVLGIVTTLAWFLTCVDLQDAIVHEEALRGQTAAESIGSTTKKKLARIEGRTMHELGIDELKTLLQEQRALAEATERAIEVRRLKKDMKRAGATQRLADDDNASVVSGISRTSSAAPPPFPGRGGRGARTETVTEGEEEV